MKKMAHVVSQKEGRVSNDYYPTAPLAVRALVLNYPVPSNILEPAAGRGWISAELQNMGYMVTSKDLYPYDDPLTDVEYGEDFLQSEKIPFIDGVITNPPYSNKMPMKFIEKSLKMYDFTAMFCRLSFLETPTRGEFFTKYPMAKCMIMGARIQCNERYFHSEKTQIGGMISYAWFIWDKKYADPKNEIMFVNPKDYIND